jgi:hypothetical protein
VEQFRNLLKICRNRGKVDARKKKNSKEYRSIGEIDCILSFLGADTPIKSGEVILVVWIQTSLVDLQNIAQKTNDRATQTPLKSGCEFMFSGMVGSSASPLHIVYGLNVLSAPNIKIRN